MGITPDQAIKLQLISLAEFLQTSLSDAQLALYARELDDLSPDMLDRAIRLLRADADLWPGKFPLPAKIRSYLHGEVARAAINSARKIMALDSQKAAYALLTPTELLVARSFGLGAIIDRQSGSTATVYAQLRDALEAEYRALSLQKKHLAIGNAETLAIE